MIKLTMLPADDGDCLLLEYGAGTQTRRILVDGGRARTYPQIKATLAGLGGTIDLLVVTHIDQDHILGVLAMLSDPQRSVQFRDVWFNGYDELLDSGLEKFGARDGELLTSALVDQCIPWNAAAGGRSIEVGRPLAWFDDGSRLTLLSPDRAQLAALAPTWVSECARNGIIPGRPATPEPPGLESFGPLDVEAAATTPFDPDPSPTNRTSIAFLFEYEGKRLLLTGDASDGRLVDSLRDLASAEGGRLHVDALKVAHHGSDHNLSNDLLALLDCPRYLISTSGARHNHPNDIAIARILKNGGTHKELIFNYRTRGELWDLPGLKAKYGYTVLTPAAQADGFLSLEF